MIKYPRLLIPVAALLLISGTPSVAARAGAPSAAMPDAPFASPYGLIWLDVDPGPAEVSLDGEFLDAGVWLISASPGEHELRIRKTGFRSYAGRVAVPVGGSVHLDVRLQPGAAGDS